MFEDRVFIGIGGSVLALSTIDGHELWSKSLKGMLSGTITGVSLVGNRLYASQSGELFCLDPATGTLLWHNKLSGHGTGFLSIAGGGDEGPAGQQAAHASEAAAAAVIVATTAASS